MNAMVVPAVKKKVVVVGDMDLGYRRAIRFNEEQQRIYNRTVAILELDNPSGLRLVIMVPVMGPSAALAAHFLNHFDAYLVECQALTECACDRAVEDVCECMRDHLTEPRFGRLLIIPPKESARTATEALMNRLRRPKRSLVDLEGMVGHPLFAF